MVDEERMTPGHRFGSLLGVSICASTLLVGGRIQERAYVGYRNTHTRLMALFRDYPGELVGER